jgi:hypothetical protein
MLSGGRFSAGVLAPDAGIDVEFHVSGGQEVVAAATAVVNRRAGWYNQDSFQSLASKDLR